MHPTDETILLAKALRAWGRSSQMAMLEEECAELIVASKHLQRNSRDKIQALNDFANEIADVEIMIAQMKIAFELDTTVKVCRDNKLNRLAQKLENN